MKKKLAIVPSDPLSSYAAKGISARLADYFNPDEAFSDIVFLDPFEAEGGQFLGWDVLPVTPRSYRRIVQELKVDLVHAYGGQWAGELACLHRCEHTPLVVSLHDTNPDFLRPACRRADHIIAVSEAVKRAAIARGFSPQRISVIANSIDLSHWQAQPTKAPPAAFAALPQGSHALLCVGRLSEQKNQQGVIAALAHLAQNYHVFFAGDGELKPQLKAQAERLGVTNRCHFLGAVNYDDLPNFYTHTAALINPSRWEGFGMVFIEAMACGAAVITSALPPMNDLFKHEQQAYLIDDVLQPAAIASAIRAVCESPELRQTLSLNGQRLAQSFSHTRINPQRLACYQKVMTQPATSLKRAAWMKRQSFALRFSERWHWRRVRRQIRSRLWR